MKGGIYKLKNPINRARKDRRLTAEEFGAMLGVTENYIYKLEKGRQPSRNLLLKMLAKFPELSVHDFTEEKEEELAMPQKPPTRKATPDEKKLVY